MAYRFETGCVYEPYANEFESIRVIRRTEKTIFVKGVEMGVQWRMRVRTDADGNEYTIDSTVPARWRDAFTYKAEWKIEWEDENGN